MSHNEAEQPLFDEETLYRELFTPLYRYLYFRVRDDDVAHDLTQGVFLKFLLQKERPESHEHARRLLYTIAKTTLIDHWRVSGRRVTVDIESIEEIPSTLPNPEEDALRTEDKQYVERAMEVLSEKEHEIVSLRLSGDLDYETIAAIVGVSPANARQLYSRALKKVEAALRLHNYYN